MRKITDGDRRYAGVSVKGEDSARREDLSWLAETRIAVRKEIAENLKRTRIRNAPVSSVLGR